jgi:hypothetical protein
MKEQLKDTSNKEIKRKLLIPINQSVYLSSVNLEKEPEAGMVPHKSLFDTSLHREVRLLDGQKIV